MQQLVTQTSSICSPPLIYHRLNTKIADPCSSVKDIGQIIADDPGLTVRLLKLANSPLYGLQKVESIDRAITLIGTRELRDLALAVSTMESFPGIPAELLDMTKFWQHSIACGIIARNLAIYQRELSTERFFVAGILHDLGQLVICKLLPEIVTKLIADCKAKRLPYPQAEKNHLGFNHAELGAALLDSWKIPKNIAEPVACHHTPLEAKNFQREAAIIHLADIICQSLGYGASDEFYVTPFDTEAWRILNIPIGALEEVIFHSEDQISSTYQIMTVKK